MEGKPIVSKLNPIHIGDAVDKQFQNDWNAEDGAVKSYNEGISLAAEVKDNGTRDMLVDILKDEEDHIDEIEKQLGQIEKIGMQNYLMEQME
ncbi:MAG: ferritin-like domain-containing protein [Spirochaetia bacterium]